MTLSFTSNLRAGRSLLAASLALFMLCAPCLFAGAGEEPEQVTVTLESKPGVPPCGFFSKPGWPFPLTPTAPDGLRVPPPGPGKPLYGKIPLAGRSVFLAVVPGGSAKDPSTLFVDRNHDWDFTNDTPGRYRGEGTYGSAGTLELDVFRPDGATFPYRIWLWTSVNHPQGKENPGFNYYATCFKEGQLPLCSGNLCKMFRVVAGDPSQIGLFEPGEVSIDWNGNGQYEDSERLKSGATCIYEDKAVRLLEIAPFADKVVFEITPAGNAEKVPTDVMSKLAREPIPGNLPPELGIDLYGHAVEMKDFKGKVVLVDFWATWCGPCMRELPNVKAAYDRFHDKGFEIIGVSLDKDMNALRACLQREGISWNQICDGNGWESDTARRWLVKSIPATFLVGRDGRITATGLRGDSLQRSIEKELAKPR